MPLSTMAHIHVRMRAAIMLSRDAVWPCDVLEVGLSEVVTHGIGDRQTALSEGAFVNLQFTLPNSTASLQTPAQVVSAQGPEVRLAFDMPDHAVVKTLNDWAVQLQPRAERGDVGFDRRRALEIFDANRLVAHRYFEDRLPLIPAAAKDNLFERAHNASSNSEQAELFDAMQEVERIMSSISHGFLNGLEDSLDGLWSGREGTAEVRDSSPEELSLIDTGSFNDWLLTVQIIERSRRKLEHDETPLLERFSQLLDRDITTGQVAFCLEGVCSVFHDALQNLGASRRSRHALLIAFEIKIAGDLTGLHSELMDLLAQSAVQPVVQPLASARHGDSGGVAIEEIVAENVGSEPDTLPPAEPLQNKALQTSKTLIELYRGATDATQATDSTDSSPTTSLNAGQVIGELADFGALGWQDWQQGEPLKLAHRAGEFLSRNELRPNSDTEDVLALVSDLVDTMLLDALVHPDIKSRLGRLGRLGRLALPLTRAALAGDLFFCAGRPSSETVTRQFGGALSARRFGKPSLAGRA